MAKKRRRFAALFDAFLAWLGERFDRIDSATRAWALRGAAVTGLAVVLMIGAARLLRGAESVVHAGDKYHQPLILEWTDLPDWLREPDNAHVLDGLVALAGLHDDDSLLDPDLAFRIGTALAAPQAGWVESVERVEARPDGVVAVRCKFRQPRAWVKQGSYCYLIDDQGVRLPGRYDATDCQASALMTLVGVKPKPPTVGQRWNAAEVQDGLKLVNLLATRSFHHEISAVNVSNHDGRVDRSRPHIELVTGSKGSRIWWGLPPDRECGKEITAGQKVTLLETLYRQWGHLSVNRPYIDIRTWPDRVAMPLEIPTSTQPRVLRG